MNNGRDYWDASVVLSPAAMRIHAMRDISAPYEKNPLEMTIMIYSRDMEDTITDTLATLAEAMRVTGQTYEIVVMDDASKDATVAQAQAFMDNHPDLHIILSASKNYRGQVRSYVDGAFIGCGKYYRLVRADDNESLATMVDVFKATGDADIILPYDMDGGTRSVITTICRIALNLLTGQRINDYNGSHIHLRYNVMRWHPDTRGGAFHMELLCRLLSLGFTYKQVPTRNLPRRDGRASADTSDVLSLLHVLVRVAIRTLSDQRHQPS